MQYFDRITKQYLEVDLNEELERELKRSYWREAQQERRYYARCCEFNNALEYDSVLKFNPEVAVIRKLEVEVLLEILPKLSERDLRIIRLIYYEDKTKTEVARILGISKSYVTKRVSKIKMDLRHMYLEVYEY